MHVYFKYLYTHLNVHKFFVYNTRRYVSKFFLRYFTRVTALSLSLFFYYNFLGRLSRRRRNNNIKEADLLGWLLKMMKKTRVKRRVNAVPVQRRGGRRRRGTKKTYKRHIRAE